MSDTTFKIVGAIVIVTITTISRFLAEHYAPDILAMLNYYRYGEDRFEKIVSLIKAIVFIGASAWNFIVGLAYIALYFKTAWPELL